jgi:hypothetical protein
MMNDQIVMQHKASIHNIGVKWFVCDQDSFEYKAKESG